MRRLLTGLLLMALVAGGCARGGSPQGPGPGPPGPPKSKAALELDVLHRIGPFFYCDPDVYPIGHGTPASNAAAGVRQIEQQDPGALRTILADLGVQRSRHYDVATEEAIWDRYKRMNALGFAPADGGYRFSYTPADPDHPDVQPTAATTVTGFVSTTGVIRTNPPSRNPNFYGCPICLLRNARIATPNGPVRIADLSAGDPIWTTDANGDRTEGRVLALRSLRVGPRHAVVAVHFADDRRLVASPGHPLDDGRVAADLTRGQRYDGSRIVDVHVRYVGGRTYDVLPSGPTGDYWADRVLVGSTLARAVS